jgi:hypothetical protein
VLLLGNGDLDKMCCLRGDLDSHRGFLAGDLEVIEDGCMVIHR